MIRSIKIFTVLLLITCSCDNPTQIEAKDEVIVDLYLNETLKEDAIQGKTYENQFFQILTDSNVVLYKKQGVDFVQTKDVISRGESFSIVDSIVIFNEYSPIRLSDKDEHQYYIKRPFNAFRQPFEGMKYAVVGFAEKGQSMEVYDSNLDKYEKKELPENSQYYFVITKDDSYVNSWDDVKNKPITGRFCCDMYIPQAKDHIKINPKFKSKLSEALVKE